MDDEKQRWKGSEREKSRREKRRREKMTEEKESEERRCRCAKRSESRETLCFSTDLWYRVPGGLCKVKNGPMIATEKFSVGLEFFIPETSMQPQIARQMTQHGPNIDPKRPNIGPT